MLLLFVSICETGCQRLIFVEQFVSMSVSSCSSISHMSNITKPEQQHITELRRRVRAEFRRIKNEKKAKQSDEVKVTITTQVSSLSGIKKCGIHILNMHYLSIMT